MTPRSKPDAKKAARKPRAATTDPRVVEVRQYIKLGPFVSAAFLADVKLVQESQPGALAVPEGLQEGSYVLQNFAKTSALSSSTTR